MVDGQLYFYVDSRTIDEENFALFYRQILSVDFVACYVPLLNEEKFGSPAETDIKEGNINSVAASASEIYCDAYDGEGFLRWTKPTAH